MWLKIFEHTLILGSSKVGKLSSINVGQISIVNIFLAQLPPKKIEEQQYSLCLYALDIILAHVIQYFSWYPIKQTSYWHMYFVLCL